MSWEGHTRSTRASLDAEKNTVHIYQMKITHEKNISFSHSSSHTQVLSSFRKKSSHLYGSTPMALSSFKQIMKNRQLCLEKKFV